ncbi:MAG: arginine--tRNA ligase, partial [Synergistaceae bacterium]|nr:arginine--tRNA ligase [Synergistaceae bacterium]
AMGKDPDKFEVLLIQLVNLLRGGKQVAMSTRSGEFIELKAVCDEVGVDATRFFFLTRRSDSQLDFD